MMTQLGSSLVASFGTAFMSPIFSSSSHTQRIPECCIDGRETPTGEFECQLSTKLEDLKKDAKINLDWLRHALGVVTYTHSNILEAIPGLQVPLSEREMTIVNEYLDDSVKLLDACNVLGESFAHVERYHTLVQLALHSLDSKEPISDIKVTRIQNVFHECIGVIKKKVEVDREGPQRSKPENCSSMVRRMGEKLNNNSSSNNDNNNAFVLSAMHGAKTTTIFLCGVLSIALLVKPKRLLPSLHLTHQTLWASSMLKLQHKVKEEIDRRKAIKGSSALLEELDNVHLEVKALYHMFLYGDKGCGGSGTVVMDEIRQSVSRLKKFAEEIGLCGAAG